LTKRSHSFLPQAKSKYDNPRDYQYALINLGFQLEQLAASEPQAHARIVRLIERLSGNPEMSDAEMAAEISLALGMPPGTAH
jgi:hypothetical protein